MGSKAELEVMDLERRFGIVSKEYAICDQHGEYIAIIRKALNPSGCPTCQTLRTEAEQLERKRVKFIAEQLVRAQIPKRFENKTFADYQVNSDAQKRAIEACADYVDNFGENLKAGRCLLLLGRVGTGKTHLATAIANFLIRECGVSAIYRTVGEILGAIRATFNGGEESEDEIFRVLINQQLLILDEVGATKASEFEQATMFRIINARYEKSLPTVVVSNLGPKDLPAVIGERCMDRLRENGAIAIPFTWESRRGKEGF